MPIFDWKKAEHFLSMLTLQVYLLKSPYSTVQPILEYKKNIIFCFTSSILVLKESMAVKKLSLVYVESGR